MVWCSAAQSIRQPGPPGACEPMDWTSATACAAVAGPAGETAAARARAHKLLEYTGDLFSSKNFCKIRIVALSFVFDKYYPIMNSLASKDLSRQFRPNCPISFYFRLYLLLYAYV